jgi:hypothetical protein
MALGIIASLVSQFVYKVAFINSVYLQVITESGYAPFIILLFI